MILDDTVELFARIVRVRGRSRVVKALKPLLSESRVCRVKVGHVSFNMQLNAWDNIPSFHLRFYGYWERDETNFLTSVLQPGDTFYDIGANVGYFTLLGAAMVGKGGAVHSFEPVPATFRRLQDNVQLNPDYRAILHPVALSETCGHRQIYFHPKDSGSNSFGELSGSSAALSVATDTLDSHIAAHCVSRVAWMKLDVEGAETMVIRGGKNVLQDKDAPSLLLEVNPDRLRALGSSEVELQTLLHDLGYQLYVLERGRKVPIGPTTKHRRALTTVIAEKRARPITTPIETPPR